MEMLQGVWKQHLGPRAVVGYGVKIFLPSPPNYLTRSPEGFLLQLFSSLQGNGLLKPRWGLNLEEFKRRFDPATTNGEGNKQV